MSVPSNSIDAIENMKYKKKFVQDLYKKYRPIMTRDVSDIFKQIIDDCENSVKRLTRQKKENDELLNRYVQSYKRICELIYINDHFEQILHTEKYDEALKWLEKIEPAVEVIRREIKTLNPKFNDDQVEHSLCRDERMEDIIGKYRSCKSIVKHYEDFTKIDQLDDPFIMCERLRDMYKELFPDSYKSTIKKITSDYDVQKEKLKKLEDQLKKLKMNVSDPDARKKASDIREEMSIIRSTVPNYNNMMTRIEDVVQTTPELYKIQNILREVVITEKPYRCRLMSKAIEIPKFWLTQEYDEQIKIICEMVKIDLAHSRINWRLLVNSQPNVSLEKINEYSKEQFTTRDIPDYDSEDIA